MAQWVKKNWSSVAKWTAIAVLPGGLVILPIVMLVRRGRDARDARAEARQDVAA